MTKARARHILVPTAVACEDIKTQITQGADFAELARELFAARPAPGPSERRARAG